MSRNRRDNDRNRNDDTGTGYWGVAVAAGGVVAAVGGLAYWLSRGKTSNSSGQSHDQQQQVASHSRASQGNDPGQERPRNNQSRTGLPSVALSLLQYSLGTSRGTPSRSVRRDPITNMNGLLDDIYVRYIALKDDDFKMYYEVFCEIFYNNLHKSMKEVDAYYRKYSGAVQFAGSHFDNLRIVKPDEFDMDIVIEMPLNIRGNPDDPAGSDIVIEPKSPGFLQLRMGVQFQNLHMRDGAEWQNNKAAFQWKDDRNYLLRSKFIHWFKGVVDKALNQHGKATGRPAQILVKGVPYTVATSESGPAVTLIIKNEARGFKLDVDLVPALKFPIECWPVSPSYRAIPQQCIEGGQGYWMVVPKPNKAGQTVHDENRSWRIALHNQERGLLHDTKNLRQGIRLMKKLRDAQGMDKIASYYVKTLFFSEVVERNDPSFWSVSSPATIFKLMVKKLHAALKEGKIPYFWNRDNNLIGGINRAVLSAYATKLAELMKVMEEPTQYKEVARYLLSPEEFFEYNMSVLHI